MRYIVYILIFTAMIQISGCGSGNSDQAGLFENENLIAWCIVPFDAVERTPQQRADMLEEVGISQLAYDYRDKHIPSFEEEIRELKEHEIRLSAVWLWVDPANPWNEANKRIMQILEENDVATELWVGFPDQAFEGLSDDASLQLAVETIEQVLERVEEHGNSIALYNHGGWYGEPENQIRIIEAIGSEKVKIVYNFHHGHHQVEHFGELLDQMLPYLSAININGMRVEGPKIITLGEGDRELEMLRMVKASGYSGTIGILGHTDGEDIRVVLERNLNGLKRLKESI